MRLTGIGGAEPLVACPTDFPVNRVLERPTLSGEKWTWADPAHTGEGAERTAMLTWETLLTEGHMALRFRPGNIALAVKDTEAARRLVQTLWAQGLPIHHPDGTCIAPAIEAPLDGDGLVHHLEAAGRVWLAPLGIPGRDRCPDVTSDVRHERQAPD
jgi:hypothetical protein